MKDLAHKITQAYFWYDPYNGADFEEVEAAVLEQLNDIDRCHEMLEELSTMVIESNN